MNKKYPVFIGILLALAVILSGCASGLTAASWPAMTADANNAYLAGGPYVYAVNLQTGAQVWRFPDKASASPFDATPVLTSDGQLIVGGFDKKLYSLNLQTGKSNWQFTAARDRWIGGALVLDKMIYAPNADYNLYALNLQGQLQWTFEADQSLWGVPVSDGANIYFGTLGHKVYAVNAQTGKQIWMQKVDGAVLGSPKVGNDGSLYVGSYAGTIYALNTSNGVVRWSSSASSWIWSGPLLDGGNLYIGDANGKLWAFSVSNGAKVWKQDLQGAIIGTPLSTGNSLVTATTMLNAPSAGSVYFLDSTGKILHTIPLPGSSQVYANPVLAGNIILIAPTGQATDPILLAIDSAGAIKWSFIPPK